MKWIAPWHVEGRWVCENHPDRDWPDGCDCGGAGMPSPELVADIDKFEAEAQAVLGARRHERDSSI